MAFTNRIKKELFFEVILSSIGISLVSLFYKENLLLVTLIIATWAIGVMFWHTKHDVYLFLIGAITGSIGELIAVHFGAWQYANPTFLGIPIWLPFVWGLAMMITKHITETFVEIEMR